MLHVYSSLESMITDNDLVSNDSEHNQIKTILHHTVMVQISMQLLKSFVLWKL